MSQETIKILKMLEDGKISSQEAESLLSALGGNRNDHGLSPNEIKINPGKIVTEAMLGVKEGLQGLKGLKGLRDIHIEMDDLRGSEMADEEKVLTVPSTGITELSVNQPRSDFEIVGCDGEQITIKADIQVWADDEDEAQEKLESLNITTETDSGILKVKVDGPPWTKKRRAKVDFTIEMPKNIIADISSASGEISVSNLYKGTKLNTASGDIEISGCKGENSLSTASGNIEANDCTEASLKINTASGDIEVKDCSGNLVFQSVSGDVCITLNGDIQGQTVSGDIDLSAGKSKVIKIHSTSGDIQFNGQINNDSNSNIATVSGDVSVELEDGSSAMLEAGTVSGDIECDLELAELRKSSRSFSGKLGTGQGNLVVKTVSGDIEIN